MGMEGMVSPRAAGSAGEDRGWLQTPRFMGTLFFSEGITAFLGTKKVLLVMSVQLQVKSKYDDYILVRAESGLVPAFPVSPGSCFMAAVGDGGGSPVTAVPRHTNVPCLGADSLASLCAAGDAAGEGKCWGTLCHGRVPRLLGGHRSAAWGTGVGGLWVTWATGSGKPPGAGGGGGWGEGEGVCIRGLVKAGGHGQSLPRAWRTVGDPWVPLLHQCWG